MKDEDVAKKKTTLSGNVEMNALIKINDGDENIR